MIEQDRINKLRDRRAQNAPTAPIGSNLSQSIDETYLTKLRERREQKEQEQLQQQQQKGQNLFDAKETQDQNMMQKAQTKIGDTFNAAKSGFQKAKEFGKEAITRGYDTKDLREAEPTTSEAKTGAIKLAGEFANLPILAGGFLATQVAKLGSDEYEQNVKDLFSKYAEKSAKALSPESAGEAKAMLIGDIATLPAGGMKNIVTGLERAATKEAVQTLARKTGLEIAEDAAIKIAKTSDADEITRILNQQIMREISATGKAAEIDNIVNQIMQETEQGTQVYTEMDQATSGNRLKVGELTDGGYMTKEPSTFPDWVPADRKDLRTRVMFDKVQQHILDGTVPKAKLQKELYDMAAEEAMSRMGKTMDEVRQEMIGFQDLPDGGVGKAPTPAQSTRMAQEAETASARDGVLELSKRLEKRLENAKNPEQYDQISQLIAKVDDWAEQLDKGTADVMDIREELQLYGIDAGKKIDTGVAQGKTLTEVLEGKAPESLPVVDDTQTVKKKVSESITEVEKKASEAKATSETKFDPDAYVKENVAKREAARKADKGSLISRIREWKTKGKEFAVDSQARIEDMLTNYEREHNVKILEEQDYRKQYPKALRASEQALDFMNEEGLTKIIQEVDDVDALNEYLIAKRSLELDAKGIETGRNIAQDAQLIKAYGGKYEKYAQQFRDYTHKILDYLVETGIKSREQVEKLKAENPNYVPFNRIFNDAEEELLNKTFGTRANAGLSKQTVVQRIFGSKREVEDVFASMIDKTKQAFEQGERNVAGKVFASYEKLEGNPAGLKQLRKSENVQRRLELFEESKGLTKEKNKLNRLIKTRNKWARQLQKELKQLNEQGIKSYLSRKADDIGTPVEKITIKDIKTVLSNQDVRNLVNAMIVKDPAKIGIIKKKIGKRDKNLSKVLDDLESLSSSLDEAEARSMDIADERKLIADAESRGKSTFSFFKDGHKEIWEVDPSMEAALKNMDAHQIGLVGRILALPVRVAKVGITGLNPSFILRNIGKDQVSAFINADHGLRGSVLNPKNFFKSFYSIMKRDDVYKMIRKEGGSYTSYDFWRNASFTNVEKIRASRNIPSRVAYTVKHPGEFLRTLEDIVAKSEELTRAQNARAAHDAAIKAGKTKTQAAKIGAQAFRETTVDFMRAGNGSKVLNSALMYFNPGIQGSRTLLTNLRRKPIRTTAKIVSTVMVPAMYITTWNLSDPKRREAYQDIPEWEKENNLIFIPPNPTKNENGKWNVIKIPWSAEVAQLARPVRRVQETIHGLDPIKFGEIADSLFQTATSLDISSPEGLASTFTPQMSKPSLEVFTNTKFYTSAPVVPDNLKKQAPEAQYFTNETTSGKPRKPTSGTIKRIAQKVGLSPIKTEFWINETFGGLSQNIIHNVDYLANKAGIIGEDEIGGEGVRKSIARSFNEAYGGQEMNEYYQEREDKIKEISKIPEGPERTTAIQDYVSGLSDDQRKSAMFAFFDAGVSTKGVSTSQDIIDILPTFNKVKELHENGNEAEARKIVNQLSEDEYKKYKKAMTSYKRQQTAIKTEEMESTVEQVKTLSDQGNKLAAQRIVSAMSDEEYKLYLKAKENLGY